MATPIREINPSPTYLAGTKWIGKHIDELVAQHPNQWVGVYKDRVVAADPDLERAHHAVPAGIPDIDVVFQFVDDGTLLFAASASLTES